MKLIVGLGNPGPQYAKTRHNIGFMFIDKYAEIKKCDFFKSKFKGEYVTFDENGEKVILFKPLTYMNLSGEAVREISDYFHIEHKDILVVYDDKDIPFAALRLREKGSPGSHNGIKNITLMLNGEDFNRIRVGMGTPISNQDMVSFVLSKFTDEELKALNESYENVAKACDLFIKGNFNMAMNKYNFRKK